MFREFHRHRANWNNYIFFCEWWNFNSFTAQDFEYYKPENGDQKIMSLAEQAYISYCSAILAIIDVNRINAFIPWMENLKANYPKFQYPPYFLSKMYLALGDKQKAYDTILPFVKTKPNDFWVWQMLGDILDDEDTKFKCYCKALTCRTKPEMLVSLKEKFAYMLVRKGMLAEAKHEIEEVRNIRYSNGWRVSNSLVEVCSSQWYSSVLSVKDNAELYNSCSEDVDMLIYPDIRVLQVLITDINPDKHAAGFIDIDGNRGYFFYNNKQSKDSLQLLNAYRIKVKKQKSNGPTEVASFQKADIHEWDNNLCRFSGTMQRAKNRKFGFVKSDAGLIFIPQNVTGGAIKDGEQISGVAVKVYDKSKGKLNWKMIIKD